MLSFPLFPVLGCASACRESFRVFTFRSCNMTQPAGRYTYCQSKARYLSSNFRKISPYKQMRNPVYRGRGEQSCFHSFLVPPLGSWNGRGANFLHLLPKEVNVAAVVRRSSVQSSKARYTSNSFSFQEKRTTSTEASAVRSMGVVPS